jgi:hypothetical protein
VQRPLAAALWGAFARSSFGGSIAGDSPRQPKSLGTCVGGSAETSIQALKRTMMPKQRHKPGLKATLAVFTKK